jgi:hypothetical protein
MSNICFTIWYVQPRPIEAAEVCENITLFQLGEPGMVTGNRIVAENLVVLSASPNGRWFHFWIEGPSIFDRRSR